MKQNVSETESNWCFCKNVKNMSIKQESVSGATFKAWPFSSIFNFGCKDGQVTAATCKYCQLTVSQSDEALCKFLPISIVAKNSILNVAEFLDLPLKTSPCLKTGLVSCETSLFYFKMRPPLSKVMFCQWLFKVKITCKRASFTKK